MSPYPSSEKMGGVGELHSEIRCEEQFQCKWTYMTFILQRECFLVLAKHVERALLRKIIGQHFAGRFLRFSCMVSCRGAKYYSHLL